MPAAHGSHAPELLEGAAIPGGQGWGVVDPGVHEWPAMHSMHSEEAVSDELPEKVPEGQKIGAAVPSGQYLPGGQGTHDVWPVSTW